MGSTIDFTDALERVSIRRRNFAIASESLPSALPQAGNITNTYSPCALLGMEISTDAEIHVSDHAV